MRQCPIIAQQVDVRDCGSVVARHVDEDIGVYKVGHLSTGIVAKAVDVGHAIGDVVAVRPHAGEPKIADGPGLGVLPLGHVHLDHRAFLDLHVRKGLEDAVLVFRWDRNGFAWQPLQ